MANQHPATPTAQEINKLFMLPLGEEERVIAAFCAGADQELEACCKWLPKLPPWSAEDLRKHRRPNPPSLKEQALKMLRPLSNPVMPGTPEYRLYEPQAEIIRRALEALPND